MTLHQIVEAGDLTPAEAQQILDLMRRGNMDGAARHFRKSLKRASRRPEVGGAQPTRLSPEIVQALDALSNPKLQPPERWRALGVLHLAAGRFGDAEFCFRAALAETGSSGELLTLWGDALRNLRRNEDALAAYDRALSLDPSQARAHGGRALALQMTGNVRAAEESFRSALAVEPANAGLLLEFGNLLKAAGRFADALSIYSKALAARPDYAEAFNNRGTVLQTLERHSDALADFERALKINPDHLFAHLNRGIALCRLGRVESAVAAFETALAINPGTADAYHNLGIALQMLERHEEAIAAFEAAAVLNPRFPNTHLSRGNVLQSLGRFEEACAAYEDAVRADSGYLDARVNWAMALQELARHEDAIAVLDAALEQRPDYPEAQWNRANSLLCFGPSEEAWKAYEHRLHLSWGQKLPEFGLPLLSHEAPAGKRLLVQWEQRFGDVIQMLRYVPLLEAEAAECHWQIAHPLRDLVKASFPGIRLTDLDTCPPGLDYRVPFTSLPLALRTFSEAQIPRNVPYLRPSERALERWRLELSRPAVGLTWRGNPKPPGRDVPIEALAPLLARKGLTFVSLQQAVSDKEQAILKAHDVQELGDRIVTFDDTGAILSQLDLVISIDTAVCHLAGAMARPTCLLLKYGCDWRWSLARSDCPWYPATELIRQHRPGDWEVALQELDQRLEALG